MLKAEIRVADKEGHLYELFGFEQKEMLGGRVRYDVTRESGDLVVSVQAEDSVALRSALNTVTKIITVYEKARSSVENGQVNRGEN